MQDTKVLAVLVTGGAGFLGAHLTASLLTAPEFQKAVIVVLDDLSGGFLDNLPSSDRIHFHQGSVCDHATVEGLFQRYQFEYVYHLAAYAAEGLSHFIRRFNYTNNLIGSINIINACVRYKARHLVFTSSIAVYGTGQVPLLESTSPKPEDPYGIAKYAVELDLKAAHEFFGLNYTIFRPHNVYGELQNIGDRYRNVVGIFMNRVLQGQSLPVFGDGLQQRAFSYVGDLISPMLQAPFLAAANCGVFNIGSTVPTTVWDLAMAVCSEFQVTPDIQFLPARNEVKLAWADHSLCDHVFGPQRQTPLAEGLHRMAEWVRRAGPRASKSFDDIELTDGLPASWIQN